MALSIPSIHPYNIAFLALHFLGATAFIIVLGLTEVLHRYNIRHHAWRSFCVSWIVFGLSYSVGTCVILSHRNEDNVGRGVMTVCVIQSGLIYAAPVLVVNTTLGLIIQLRSIMLLGMGKTNEKLGRCPRLLIVIIPWMIWIINFFGVLVPVIMEPSMINMNNIGTYCHLNIQTVSRVMASWLAITASIIIAIEIHLVILMYRRGFQLAGKCDASRTAIRLGIFILQAIVCIGVALGIIINESSTVLLDLLIAIQSPCAALIFGLRTSILCCSARRKESRLAKRIRSSFSRHAHTLQSYTAASSHSSTSVDDLPSVNSSVLVIGYEEETERRFQRFSE